MSILHSLQLVDERLFTRLFQGKHRLKRLACHLSHSADGYLYVLLPFIYWLGYPVQGRTFFRIALCAFVIERIIYFLLKKNFKRRRPPAAISGFTSLVTPSDEFSFPSGHTSAAFLFSTLCVLWFGAVALPLFIWSAMVALSRVLLGVHFVTDTIAGAVIGSSIGYFLVTYLV
jgi:undecaprenyl-diphosphatase